MDKKGLFFPTSLPPRNKSILVKSFIAMQIHPFQALVPCDGKIQDPDAFFKSCKDDYLGFLSEGYFKRWAAPAVFGYEIATPSHRFRGIVAALDIRDYLEGRLKIHESTIAEKEAVQETLFASQQAITKPILTTYFPSDRIRGWIRETTLQTPVLEIAQHAEPVTHRLFAVEDPERIALLQRLFREDMPMAFIADGHHRCAAAAALYQQHPQGPFNRLMCAFFDPDELEIHGFHRIIDLKGLSGPTFLEALSHCCTLQPCQEVEVPAQERTMLLLLDNVWYQLHWKPELCKDPWVPDVQLLNERVFRDILGIANIRKEPRITYLENPAGIDVLQDKTNERPGRAAFCLSPVSMQRFLEMVARGTVFPPKSTWFEPRMKNGLFVYTWKIGQ